MENTIFPYWLAVEESKLVHFRDLAHMIAKAIYPSDTEEMRYAAARVNLDEDLPKAVQSGELIVRNPAGLGSLTLAIGETLKSAVILPQDLRPFLERRGIELRLMPHGSGPLYWTLENAAASIAEQEGWHNGARAALLDEMKAAADGRNLRVRDPRTDIYKTAGEVSTFWELVTPADVNAWLENQGAPYRWEVAPSDGQALAANEPALPKPLQRHPAQEAEILRVIKQAGYDPQQLPKNERGKPGVRLEIRNALKGNPLFAGSTVFDKAWERLQRYGEIASMPAE